MRGELTKLPEFPKWFERFWEMPEFPDFGSWFERRPVLPGLVHPLRVEESWGEHDLTVRVEAPGIDPDRDAEVTVADGVLRIHIERKMEERKEEAKGRFRTEFRYGEMTRSVLLPSGVHEDEVSAAYKDGVLTIVVPFKKEAVAASKVAITRG